MIKRQPMHKILIIDDNEELLFLLKHQMDNLNKDVRIFSNPKRAIVSAVLNKPDLVICDLKMPAMNGYQVYDEINNNPYEEPIPFIMFSGADTEKEAVEKSGIRFISKNRHFNEVISKLTEISA